MAQEVIITVEDCEVGQGITVEDYHDDTLKDLFYDRIKYRYTASPVANPKTGEIIIEADQALQEEDIEILKELEVTVVEVRSPLSCQAEKGLCKMCYGLSLANLQPIMI